MLCNASYNLHREREGTFMDFMRELNKSAPPNNAEISATALLNLRVRQQLDARILIGKIVSIRDEGVLITIIDHCEVGDSTATTCFSLFNRKVDGSIKQLIEITDKMDLFVEDAHV